MPVHKHRAHEATTAPGTGTVVAGRFAIPPLHHVTACDGACHRSPWNFTPEPWPLAAQCHSAARRSYARLRQNLRQPRPGAHVFSPSVTRGLSPLAVMHARDGRPLWGKPGPSLAVGPARQVVCPGSRQVSAHAHPLIRQPGRWACAPSSGRTGIAAPPRLRAEK